MNRLCSFCPTGETTGFVASASVSRKAERPGSDPWVPLGGDRAEVAPLCQSGVSGQESRFLLPGGGRYFRFRHVGPLVLLTGGWTG